MLHFTWFILVVARYVFNREHNLSSGGLSILKVCVTVYNVNKCVKLYLRLQWYQIQR